MSRVVEVPNIRFEALNLRGAVIANAATVTWTTHQKISMVINEGATLGNTATTKAMANVFEKEVAFAPTSDKMSVSFVDSALTVNRRVLSNDVCKELLEEMDAQYGAQGPLNSVYKFQAIVSKAQTATTLRLSICGLIDGFEMGTHAAEDMGVRRLREFVELMMLKDHILAMRFVSPCTR